MRVRLAVFYQDQRVDRNPVITRLRLGSRRHKSMLRRKSLTGFRLERSKPKIPVAVVIDHEVDRSVAEVADPIEQDHRAHKASVALNNAECGTRNADFVMPALGKSSGCFAKGGSSFTNSAFRTPRSAFGRDFPFRNFSIILSVNRKPGLHSAFTL
jgi:hypothetical protein